MNPTLIYRDAYFSKVPEIKVLAGTQVLSFKNDVGDTYFNVMDQGNVARVPTTFVENGTTYGIGNSTARTDTTYYMVEGVNAMCDVVYNGTYFGFYKVSQTTAV